MCLYLYKKKKGVFCTKKKITKIVTLINPLPTGSYEIERFRLNASGLISKKGGL